MRRAARTDRNHTEIVDALRKAGCSVQSLAAVGKGCPDLLVARNGQLWLMEVKDGSKPPSARELTWDQILWHQAWNCPVYTVLSIEDALAIATVE